ncbi:hypothetical protein AB0F91_09015 [Amycolatopsis sp. NPDC023774]|uniref:hypothetical protein n=1 Tax=Amycolatopsis sp. NPDC023774 TaxID=3155015 RepID=UPI0033F810FE
MTGTDGGFTFADPPARYYQLYRTTLPNGWLLADAYEGFDVTGDQNIECARYRRCRTS